MLVALLDVTGIRRDGARDYLVEVAEYQYGGLHTTFIELCALHFFVYVDSGS